MSRGSLTLTPWCRPNRRRRNPVLGIFQVGRRIRGWITDHQHPRPAHAVHQRHGASRSSKWGFTLAGGPRGQARSAPSRSCMSSALKTRQRRFHPHLRLHAYFDRRAACRRRRGRSPGSWFRGREPDEHRYLELGARFLVHPPVVRPAPGGRCGVMRIPARAGELEPGDQKRTNASVSNDRGLGFTAVTAAAGLVVRPFSTVHALLFELTHQVGRTFVYGRFEDRRLRPDPVVPSVVPTTQGARRSVGC